MQPQQFTQDARHAIALHQVRSQFTSRKLHPDGVPALSVAIAVSPQTSTAMPAAASYAKTKPP
ncbi:MAG: hypothetical protein V7K94_02190 [Nostoc sp.]|uniref:hypothetical protein n=1 Tax=Nostoc sp. TaxID=1180 RepID=UPI002FFCD6AE